MRKKKIIYFSLLILSVLFVSTAYYSYAFFTHQVEEHGKLNLIVGTLDYQIKSNRLIDNQMIIVDHSTSEFELEIKSLNEIDSKFELYYQLNPKVEGIEVGYYLEESNLPYGEMTKDGNRKVKVVIKNKTNQTTTITFGVEGGFTNQNLVLKEGKSLSVLNRCQYKSGDTWDFSYTGDSQTFTPECDGIYKIELWGASGGDIDTYLGGKGAYTSGNLTLEKGKNLYLYVGGKGNDGHVSIEGGYNGGDAVSSSAGGHAYGATGGGATDIRLTNGTWDNFDSLKSRIMVAAGGGGANNRNRSSGDSKKYGAGNGGYGGDLIGGDGQSTDYQASESSLSYDKHFIGTGGTQIEGGKHISYDQNDQKIGESITGGFGFGNVLDQSGAGGGYYSGGTGAHGGAGGGSSFISGYPGCNAIQEESTKEHIIHTNQPNHYSGYVFTDSIMIAGNQEMPTHDDSQTMIGNTGDGYVKITYLGNGDVGDTWNYVYLKDSQPFTPLYNGIYQIELWGASGGDIDSYTGGKGAYTAGNISLQRGTPLYLYIGGAGSNSVNGGYNGGGSLSNGQKAFGSSGGGATDIRLTNGTWDNFDSLKSRIMVAAGGGGANNRNRSSGDSKKYGAGNGGYGGELIGGDGQAVDYQASGSISSYGEHTIGTGGTQTSGGMATVYDNNNQIKNKINSGLFGKSIDILPQVTHQSGAGSGYYAGGRGAHGGAGGGSSFISGYPGCDAIEDSSTENEIIHTGKPEHYSGYVFTNSIMIAGNKEMPTHDGSSTMIGNTGNGYAKITYLGN